MIAGEVTLQAENGTERLPDLERAYEENELFLLQSARDGDRAAFDTLVDANIHRIASVAYQFLQNPHETEDAVQETFVRAYQSLGNFRGDSRFRTWLIRITLNVCKNRRGSFWSRFVQSGQDEAVFNIAAEDAMKLAEATLLQEERSQQLSRALRALPEKQRLPIVLHFFEELSGAEVALILNCNESTVWSRIYSGLKSLRNHLEANDR